ncbi:hypothetical protein [Undibacterium crateris]|uniref:hypothetical protein n=1 Tax=Undibacterium crateris TaxID=2528175 RepID=UPI001389D15A|nr:hypothetical protein [Undibacterium crateris]NDI86487.1 hypothetical protein [Undibacterium crateris]
MSKLQIFTCGRILARRSPGTAALNPAPVLIMHTNQTKPPLTDSDIDHLLGKVARQSRRKQILTHSLQTAGTWSNLFNILCVPLLGVGISLLPEFSKPSGMNMLILVIGSVAAATFFALIGVQRKLDIAIELLRLHDAELAEEKADD